MKINKSVFAFLLLSLFILAACTGGGQKTQQAGFVGGKEGLSAAMSIDSASGGNKVLDAGGESFRILINLQNKGEHTVPENDVLVTLDGINFNAFSIRDPTKRNVVAMSGVRLESGKKTNPSQIPIAYASNYQTDEDADRTTNIAANVCYKYQTISRIRNLCLRKKVTNAAPNAVCKVDETKLAESSGAPFQITTFSERPGGENKVNIYVEAKNNGKGIMYNNDYLNQGKCIDSDKDKNKVHVKVELTEDKNSAGSISCSGLVGNEGVVNIIQNSMQLSCTLDTSRLQDQTYETPLRIAFDYVYKDSISTTLTIKNSNPV